MRLLALLVRVALLAVFVYALLAWGAPWFRDVGGPWVADWLARVVGA